MRYSRCCLWRSSNHGWLVHDVLLIFLNTHLRYLEGSHKPVAQGPRRSSTRASVPNTAVGRIFSSTTTTWQNVSSLEQPLKKERRRKRFIEAEQYALCTTPFPVNCCLRPLQLWNRPLPVKTLPGHLQPESRHGHPHWGDASW